MTTSELSKFDAFSSEQQGLFLRCSVSIRSLGTADFGMVPVGDWSSVLHVGLCIGFFDRRLWICCSRQISQGSCGVGASEQSCSVCPEDAEVVNLVDAVALLKDSVFVSEHSGICTPCCLSAIALFPAARGFLN